MAVSNSATRRVVPSCAEPPARIAARVQPKRPAPRWPLNNPTPPLAGGLVVCWIGAFQLRFPPMRCPHCRRTGRLFVPATYAHRTVRNHHVLRHRTALETHRAHVHLRAYPAQATLTCVHQALFARDDAGACLASKELGSDASRTNLHPGAAPSCSHAMLSDVVEQIVAVPLGARSASTPPPLGSTVAGKRATTQAARPHSHVWHPHMGSAKTSHPTKRAAQEERCRLHGLERGGLTRLQVHTAPAAPSRRSSGTSRAAPVQSASNGTHANANLRRRRTLWSCRTNALPRAIWMYVTICAHYA